MKKIKTIISSLAILGTLAFSCTVFASQPNVSFFNGQASGALSASGTTAYVSTYAYMNANQITARMYDSITGRSAENNDANGSDGHNARGHITVNAGGYRISGYHYVSAGSEAHSGTTTLIK